MCSVKKEKILKHDMSSISLMDNTVVVEEGHDRRSLYIQQLNLLS